MEHSKHKIIAKWIPDLFFFLDALSFGIFIWGLQFYRYRVKLLQTIKTDVMNQRSTKTLCFLSPTVHKYNFTPLALHSWDCRLLSEKLCNNPKLLRKDGLLWNHQLFFDPFSDTIYSTKKLMYNASFKWIRDKVALSVSFSSITFDLLLTLALQRIASNIFAS